MRSKSNTTPTIKLNNQFQDAVGLPRDVRYIHVPVTNIYAPASPVQFKYQSFVGEIEYCGQRWKVVLSAGSDVWTINVRLPDRSVA